MSHYPSRRSYIEAMEGLVILEEEDGGQKILTMKDQEQMLQEFKKENFDLKLRLYMTEKNSETAEGKVTEYEQQLAALLNNLEEQQKLTEIQAQELKESRERERQLKTQQKKLEATCQEQNERIHNLSLDLNKLSASMADVSSIKHSTPARMSRSAYFENNEPGADTADDSQLRPYNVNAPNVSHVAPMRREPASTSSYMEDTSNAALMHHDRGVHTSVSETQHFNTTTPVNKNYYNTTLDNRHNRTDGDNVGIVRPNNTRTTVDVEIPENSPVAEKKKKKKGFMNLFKLCGGKSNDPRSRESVYTKPDHARITMTTYND